MLLFSAILLAFVADIVLLEGERFGEAIWLEPGALLTVRKEIAQMQKESDGGWGDGICRAVEEGKLRLRTGSREEKAWKGGYIISLRKGLR